MQRIKDFFKRPSTIAFLAFTALYAACMAFIFWGTWALDKAPVEPDNPTTYALNDAAKWFADVCAGGRFIPSDLMHVIGGMYFWQELQYALAAYLAALGVVFYLRGRRVPLVGAYGGGAAFGLMGYCFTLFSAGHLGWFIWLMYGPFAFGLVDRCVRKGKWRNWALLGVVLAWSSAQQPDMWLLFTALTFAYGVWCLVRERRTLRWVRLFAGVGVAAAVMLATGLPQFRRALVQDLAGRDQQIAESSGGNAAASGTDGDAAREERWKFCTNWSLPPEDTLEFVVAEVHGGSNDPRVSPTNPYKGRLGQQDSQGVWHPYRQHSLYFGILTVIFSVLGVVGWWKKRRADKQVGNSPASDANPQTRTDYSDVPFWVVAAIIVYLCALGRFTSFYRLVFALPFGDYLRAPVKFVHLLEFCMAVLAGYGFAWIQERFGATRAWMGGVLCVLAVVNVVNLAYIDGKYCAIVDVSLQKASNDAVDDMVKLGGGKVFMATNPHLQMQIWTPLQQNIQRVLMQLNMPIEQNQVRSIHAFMQNAMSKIPIIRGDVRLPPSAKNRILLQFKPLLSLSKDPNSPLLSLDDREQLMKKVNKMDAVQESFGVHLAETATSFEDARFCFLPKWLHEANDTLRWIPGKPTPVGYYTLQKDGIKRSSPQESTLVLLQVKDAPEPPVSPQPPDRGAQMLTFLSVLMTAGVGAWALVSIVIAMKKQKGVNA